MSEEYTKRPTAVGRFTACSSTAIEYPLSIWSRTRTIETASMRPPGIVDMTKAAYFGTLDGGDSWVRLKGGLLQEQVGRVAIDVSASQPGVVYALMVDHSAVGVRPRGNRGVIYRSADRGESWTKTHDGYVPTYIGWDFCDIRVAPDDANRIYIGGFRFIGSLDGGKTFVGEVTSAPNTTRENVFRLHAHRGMGMHLDVHDLWIDPEHPERVMQGNDGGLFVSWDHGKTWLHLNNLPIAEFYRVHLDNEVPFQIWGGTQDNASFVGPSTARLQTGENDQWHHVFLDPWTGGDGFSTFVDPNDSKIVYYSQQQGDLKRARLGELKAEKRIKPRANAGQTKLRWAWDTPFIPSCHEGDTVLYCAAQRVMRSNDRGDSWTAISPDLARDGLLAFAESPLDTQRLIVGGGRGETHFTSDGGKTWKPAGVGLPQKPVRDVVASAHDPNRVYVVLSGKGDHDSASYVFLTNDFGEHWRSIAGNLPHESVNALAEDPEIDGLLFVGTDLGVYTSFNTGEEWHSLCSSLPTASVVDLAIHQRDKRLVAATHGLSLFLLNIAPIRQERDSQCHEFPDATTIKVRITAKNKEMKRSCSWKPILRC